MSVLLGAARPPGTTGLRLSRVGTAKWTLATGSLSRTAGDKLVYTSSFTSSFTSSSASAATLSSALPRLTVLRTAPSRPEPSSPSPDPSLDSAQHADPTHSVSEESRSARPKPRAEFEPTGLPQAFQLHRKDLRTKKLINYYSYLGPETSLSYQGDLQPKTPQIHLEDVRPEASQSQEGGWQPKTSQSREGGLQSLLPQIHQLDSRPGVFQTHDVDLRLKTAQHHERDLLPERPKWFYRGVNLFNLDPLTTRADITQAIAQTAPVGMVMEVRMKTYQTQWGKKALGSVLFHNSDAALRLILAAEYRQFLINGKVPRTILDDSVHWRFKEKYNSSLGLDVTRVMELHGPADAMKDYPEERIREIIASDWKAMEQALYFGLDSEPVQTRVLKGGKLQMLWPFFSHRRQTFPFIGVLRKQVPNRISVNCGEDPCFDRARLKPLARKSRTKLKHILARSREGHGVYKGFIADTSDLQSSDAEEQLSTPDDSDAEEQFLIPDKPRETAE